MIMGKCYFVLLLLMGTAALDVHDIYERRIYCGRQLDNVMSELCSWYYENEGSKGISFILKIIRIIVIHVENDCMLF